MNTGHRKKLEAASTDRMTILSMLEADQRSNERVVKLPEITFPYRRLPGEAQWAREKLPRRAVE